MKLIGKKDKRRKELGKKVEREDKKSDLTLPAT